MSIRHVTCPACQAGANVPATMTNIKCPSCGQVWNLNSPTAAKPPEPEPDESEQAEGVDGSVFLFAGIAGTLVLLSIIGIALALFVPKGVKETPKPAAEEVAASEPAEDVIPLYREVDLPESTRKRIYSDYRRMAQSSIEKKVFARKGSVTRESVDNMLKKIVDREITHFALNYNITEDDVLQIVAEGDAKKWPGSKKDPPPATP